MYLQSATDTFASQILSCLDGDDAWALQAARVAKDKCQTLDVQVFSDRDINTQRERIEAALKSADVFFGSLLFDYDQASIETMHKPYCLSEDNFNILLREVSALLNIVDFSWHLHDALMSTV